MPTAAITRNKSKNRAKNRRGVYNKNKAAKNNSSPWPGCRLQTNGSPARRRCGKWYGAGATGGAKPEAAPKHRHASLCSAAHSRHLQGQKLRLGGDALGADPTYLLYLPSRSRGGLRRIDFGAWPRAATLPPTIFPRTDPQASSAQSQHLTAKSGGWRWRAGSRAGLTGRSCRIGPDETCGNFCWLASTCQTCLSATSPPQRGDSRTSSRLGGETPAGARVCSARKNLRRKVKVLLCIR